MVHLYIIRECINFHGFQISKTHIYDQPQMLTYRSIHFYAMKIAMCKGEVSCSTSVPCGLHTHWDMSLWWTINSQKMGEMGKIRLRKISKLKFRPYFIWYYDFIPIKVSENHNDHGHISCNTLDIRCVIYRGVYIGCNKIHKNAPRLISK